jgi:hypothetical protein
MSFNICLQDQDTYVLFAGGNIVFDKHNRYQGSILGRKRDSSLHYRIWTRSGASPILLPYGFQHYFPEDKVAGGLKLTNHFHPVTRLRMHGVIAPLPHISSWSGP